uniref:B3 domain-containing protein Os06g0112300 n=2 Tax=Solanum tuberosum TaxID=4113 RepID=M1BVU4_SOLTU
MDSRSSFERVSNHKHSYSTMKQPEIESSGIPEIDNGEYWPLSGKPYVDLILTKTGVKPIYSMVTPVFSPSSRPFVSICLKMILCRVLSRLCYGIFW